MSKSTGFSTEHMDLSVDPFNDFYKYANGKWLEKTKIPSDESSIDSFYELDKLNQLRLKNIIKSCEKEDDHRSELITALYNSYMNTKLLNKLKTKPIKPIIDKIEKLKDKKDLWNLVGFMIKNDVDPFIDLSVEADEKNSDKYILYIEQGGLVLPDRAYYLDKKFAQLRGRYKLYADKILSYYEYDKVKSSKVRSDTFSIETKLAEFSRKNEDLLDPIKNYHKMKYEDLISKYRYLDFESLFKYLGIKDLDYVVVGQPEFLSKLDELIKDSKVDEIKSYLIWISINSFAGYLDKRFRDESFNFFGKELQGLKKNKPRWKRGISLVSRSIGEALGEKYVELYFPEETRVKGTELINDIISSFKLRMDKIEWLNPKTKERALKKLNLIKVKFGHPKKFQDYSKIKLKENDLIGNMIKVGNFYLDRDIHRIGKKVDKNEWDMNAYEVNAYYDQSNNEIVIPAGIFQSPFFNPKVDDPINYGAIGGVIGHELTHGFDDNGSKFDEKGNLNNWWLKEDADKFKTKSKAIIDLYSKVEVLPGIKINGKLTLGENTADIGGIHIAYDALQIKNKKNKKMSKDKISNFTQDQLFFISWAQIFKGKTTEQLSKLLSLIDPHSPDLARGSIPVITHYKFIDTFKDKSELKKPKSYSKDPTIW